MNEHGMLSVVILKTKTKALEEKDLEEVDMSVQEHNINRYGYKKMKKSPRPILTIFVKALHSRLLT